MKDDLISIVMPVYNAEKFLKETIESVRKQTYGNWELILIDDNSSDKSLDIIKQYSQVDKRIFYISLSKNSGAAYARNLAIKKASGEYIAFLDSDDLWLPEKLERQYDFMEKNEIAFSGTAYEQITENGMRTGKIIRPPEQTNYQKALWNNPIGTLSAMYSVKRLGKVYGPCIRKRNDYALWLKILKKTDYVYGISEVLAFYRIRKNSLSRNKISLVKYQWQLYRNIEQLSIADSFLHVCYTILSKLLNRGRVF